jgi:hypothetical protein
VFQDPERILAGWYLSLGLCGRPFAKRASLIAPQDDLCADHAKLEAHCLVKVFPDGASTQHTWE